MKHIEYNGVKYTMPEHIDFVQQVLDAGRKVTCYHGRYYYHGPAVTCDSMSEMVSLGIQCPVQSDSLGYGSIIYSTVSDPALANACDEHDDSEGEE